MKEKSTSAVQKTKFNETTKFSSNNVVRNPDSQYNSDVNLQKSKFQTSRNYTSQMDHFATNNQLKGLNKEIQISSQTKITT